MGPSLYISLSRYALFASCDFMDIKSEKIRARLQAKKRRADFHSSSGGPELIASFPSSKFRDASIGGFWPLPGEIDVRPLLEACHDAGHTLSLPCTPRVGKPLIFREWVPSDTLKKGSFNTREPYSDKPEAYPSLVLMPLLAFTATGERLGYGGGFYDRTLEVLRARGKVFACGVAYAAQEAASLPTGPHDQRLDGILTETGFRTFT